MTVLKFLLVAEPYHFEAAVGTHTHTHTHVVVLQWCYIGVTVLLQWCYTGGAVVLQRCHSGVTVVLQWYYSGGLMVCLLFAEPYHLEAAVGTHTRSGATVCYVTLVSQCCYSGVTLVVQWYYSGVTVV
jgi:hypothetical protein